jgi:hypothetical protein
MGSEEKRRIDIEAKSGLSAEDDLVLKHFGGQCRRATTIVKSKPVILADLQPSCEEIVIASVSLTISEDDLDRTEQAVYPGTEFVLRPLKDQPARRLKDALLKNAEATCKYDHANLVCANELAYPWPRDSYPDASRRQLNLENSLSELCRTYRSYIVAGTYHCTTTCFNLAKLFHPGDKTDQANPIQHAKKVSAHQIQEKVLTPYTRYVKYYQTEFGILSILICLDSYDPTMAIGMVRAFYEVDQPTRPDVVFIPSYNPSPLTGLEAAKTLSFFLSCVVVVVNESRCGGTSLNTAFMCGEPMEGSRSSNAQDTVIYRVSKDMLNERRVMLDARPDIYDRLFGLSHSRDFPF